MRLRTAQFACFVVLLSAFGAMTARSREACRDCAALHVLLAQVAAVGTSEAGQGSSPLASGEPGLPSAARNHAEQPWSMRPPAAQTSQMHAVTGIGL